MSPLPWVYQMPETYSDDEPENLGRDDDGIPIITIHGLAHLVGVTVETIRSVSFKQGYNGNPIPRENYPAAWLASAKHRRLEYMLATGDRDPSMTSVMLFWAARDWAAWNE